MIRGAASTKILLFLAGSIASIIGFASMIYPVQTEAGLGIVVGGSVSLLNEIRASGGGLAAAGIFILAGAFIAELRYAASLLAAMLYLGYAFARALSMTIDGLPDPRLLVVVAAEIAIGLLCLAAFLNHQCQRNTHSQ